MARRPDLPSRLSRPRAGATPGVAPTAQDRSTPARMRRQRAGVRRAPTRVDVRDWLGGIRFSGFVAIMLTLVILAVFILVPSISTYLDQRQRIASMQEAVAVSEAEVAALQEERERWADPNYIASQARERLYYVKPGEVVYLVENDLDESLLPQDRRPVSDQVQHTRVDWMTAMLRSVTEAGLSHTAIAPEPAQPPALPPTDAPTEAPTDDAGGE